MELTKKEADWLKSLQQVLDNCPSERLGFYTIGDTAIHVYDLREDKNIDGLMDRKGFDFGMAVERLNANIEILNFPANVHSVAG